MTVQQLDLMRRLVAEINAGNAELRRFIQRVERGDPRVCKPEYANPNYFAKFGDAE